MIIFGLCNDCGTDLKPNVMKIKAFCYFDFMLNLFWS